MTPARRPSAGGDPWIKLHSTDIFAAIPEPPSIVPALGIYRGCVTLVAGAGYSGKTFAFQALLLQLAAGHKVWGLDAPPAKVPSLHVDLEQGRDITCRRYQRLARGCGISGAEVETTLQVVTRVSINLDQKGGLAVWARELAGYRLVLIDSLRGAAPEMDENDARVRSTIDGLNGIAQDNDQAIILVHHVRKGGDGADREAIRGSSAIFDAASSVYIMSVRDGVRRLVQAKDRYRESAAELDLVFDGEGDQPMTITATTRAKEAPVDRDLGAAIIEVLSAKGSMDSIEAVRKAVRARKQDVQTALEALQRKEVVVKDRGYRLTAQFAAALTEADK